MKDCSLLTLVERLSWDRFFLLWSTEIPTVLANWAFKPASLSSNKLNPLQRRSTLLYRLVYPLPTGLKRCTGLGEIAMNYFIVYTCSSLLSMKLSPSLSSWLIEPSLNEFGPVLSKMHIRNHIVVSDHCKWFNFI